jgi:excisionase family DNA binding protein
MDRQQPVKTYTLTPQEMVKKRFLLRVGEAAYCLNISGRQVYDLINEGKLIRLKDKPIRIKAEDVEIMMNDFDE